MLKENIIRLIRRYRVTSFRLRNLGRVAYGAGFLIGPSSRIARRATILVGDRVNIGANFTAESHVTIGSDVMISSNVSFIGDDHRFDNPALTIQQQSMNVVSQAILEGDNLIGFGTIILGNVKVGRGAIIGAGSLVIKDIPPDVVAFGRPAVARSRRR